MLLPIHRTVAFLLLSWLAAVANAADVVSENLVFLKEDGRSYLLQRSLRTGWTQYDFYLDKSVGPAELYYVDPPQHDWVLDQDDVNQLKFKTGTFTVMYPGSYGELVSVDEEGIYTLDTHDGISRDDGHFGFWHAPGNYNRFVQAWVFPEAFRIIGYESNRDGEWVEQNNTLTYYGMDVNDLTFSVRYTLNDTDGDAVPDNDDRCPQTAAAVVVDEAGCEADSDHDGVLNPVDQCAATPADASVDARGCETDSDGDGVSDSSDQCPETVAGADVNRQGCEPDCDADGVVNSQDKCPRTPAGASVNAQGCEVDLDGDGVANSADECPRTPAGMQVDARGCEPDADMDGIVDSQDKCPDSAAGSVVDIKGCELDGDADGIVDSQDQCPGSPAGVVVNAGGCEVDSDADGIVDSADRCADTPAGHAVDAQGCQTDSDSDGVLNTADLCADTAAGVTVDATGCDADKPIELRGVNFHFDSDELTGKSRVILDGVAQTLRNHPGLRLEVAGHTDSAGVDDFNLDLSTRRALMVRDYLVSRGVDADQLTSQGYGEAHPVDSNETAEGRAANRRVELLRLPE